MLKKSKKLVGFTLLEILFVIAIMGVMASLGISYMSKRTEDEKIKKAALQIQQLLEAGINYYIDQSQWPYACSTKDIKKGFCTKKPTEADFSPYIPALEAMQDNSWGSDVNGYNWKFIGDQKKGKFQVSTKTPGENTAERIAALLPNAKTDKSNITAEITRPGAEITPKSSITIAGYGQLQPIDFAANISKKENCTLKDDKIRCEKDIWDIPIPDKPKQFPCPPGMQGDVILTLRHLDIRHPGKYIFLDVAPYKCTGTENNFQCQITYDAESDNQDNEIHAVYDYIFICYMPNK